MKSGYFWLSSLSLLLGGCLSEKSEPTSQSFPVDFERIVAEPDLSGPTPFRLKFLLMVSGSVIFKKSEDGSNLYDLWAFDV